MGLPNDGGYHRGDRVSVLRRGAGRRAVPSCFRSAEVFAIFFSGAFSCASSDFLRRARISDSRSFGSRRLALVRPQRMYSRYIVDVLSEQAPSRSDQARGEGWLPPPWPRPLLQREQLYGDGRQRPASGLRQLREILVRQVLPERASSLIGCDVDGLSE